MLPGDGLLVQPNVPIALVALPDLGCPKLLRCASEFPETDPRCTVHRSAVMEVRLVLLLVLLWTGRHASISESDIKF